MNEKQKGLLAVIRIAMGWVMFYAGVTKVMDPGWTSAGYLKNAKTFNGFFQSLTDPSVLPFVDFVNEWGLTLLGVSLILGIGVKLSGKLGAALMLLYYFPVLEFPHIPGAHAYIIDDHLIYALALWFLSMFRGHLYSMESWFAGLAVIRSNPTLRKLLV